MNYRRGFQRLYLVCATAWMAGTLFAMLSGRWEPWHPRKSNGGSQFLVSPEEFLAHPDPSYWSHQQRQEQIKKWLSVVAISIGLPLAVYVLVFWIAPWIQRGFGSESRHTA
jgi:hypothetical protein